MYKIVYTNRMKKDVKLMKKRGKDLKKLVNILTLLASGISLPVQYKDHSLAVMQICLENNSSLCGNVQNTGDSGSTGSAGVSRRQCFIQQQIFPPVPVLPAD